MKQALTTFIAAVITIFIFSTIVYTSCKKDPCSGVSCQNGGTCSGGTCSCQTGWTGTNCQTPVITNVSYTNQTYTPVTITVSGATYVVPVGGTSPAFSGSYGDTFSATAYTSGTNTSGGQVGAQITWNLYDPYPISGTANFDLNVSPSYVFLKINNTNPSYSMSGLYVNYQNSAQTYDNISVPNNGTTYDIGYYLAYTNTVFHANSSPSGITWTFSPSFVFQVNQYYTWDLY